tara:strand:- start:1689 stop:2807 length:1119 start_codon:yes stop_codon:yes gene_type:complete
MDNIGFSREIFDKALIMKIGNQLKAVFNDFKVNSFMTKASCFDKKDGLKDRANNIAEALVEFLPADYETSADIIKSTFKPLKKNQNNWNDFFLMPYAIYVEKKGCKKEYLTTSFDLLKAITMRFTSEFSIRTFLVNFPKATFKVLHEWARDENPNVRRLASEGCRPRLPWAREIKSFKKNPKFCIELLQILRNDDSKYVQKSVANHMNDITKDNLELALIVLDNWKKENNKNTNWIVRHALRSEIKKGNPKALKIEGYSLDPQIEISNFFLSSNKIKIGDSIDLSFTITNKGGTVENLIIDYICYFIKSNGKTSSKTFKISRKKLQKKEYIIIKKSHSFKPLSTRKIYAGKHKITLFINGKIFNEKSFELTN